MEHAAMWHQQLIDYSEDFRVEIRAHARNLARTARYCSWRLIEIELRYIQGIREAEGCFDDRAFREELDGLCRAALQSRDGTATAFAA